MKSLIIASLTLSLTACASQCPSCSSSYPYGVAQQPAPIVDMKGVNKYAYEEDLQACQAYSQKIADGAAQHATDTAVGTGLAGAILGGMLGNRSTSWFGLVVGAAEGYNAASKMDEKSVHDILTKCMTGRGYSVLN